MTTIELARKLAELNQKEEAQKAYTLYLNQDSDSKLPEEEMEAASYILYSEGDYRISFTTFVRLYNNGYFNNEIMNIMLQAFYIPNIESQKKQYEKNCKELLKYKYFFRESFPEFDELTVLFFPFDDNGFVPFYIDEKRFGDYINFNYEVIDRYFFKDLEKPILADDVYSQYQIEYLNDNVRKSEWVAKENHIYLHYTNWLKFCSYLSCLNFYYILKSQKLIFLIEDEVKQYPIDFKERFGIDYSKNKPKPIGVREINKMIWHTQLATHNGGDFFNEIIHGHPNVLTLDSVMMDKVIESINDLKDCINKKNNMLIPKLKNVLRNIKNPTDKDCMVAVFITSKLASSAINPTNRIVPALMFQPHFGNIIYKMSILDTDRNRTVLESSQYNQIKNSPIFKEFKYIKTFTPIRRITTSFAASVRFSNNMPDELKKEDEDKRVALDYVAVRVTNRSFMADPYDRLYRDSRMVRFEDGKLNPKATFTALAEFLDIPYTESMTYCSNANGINPQSFSTNVRGFDLATVYRTYDEYANDDERAYVEYCFRDVYKEFGYDFHYYNGESVDMDWMKERIEGFTCTNGYIAKTWKEFYKSKLDEKYEQGKEQEFIDAIGEDLDAAAQRVIDEMNETRIKLSEFFVKGLYFVNKEGQPLRMIPLIKLDPELLEQPLYH